MSYNNLTEELQERRRNYLRDTTQFNDEEDATQLDDEEDATQLDDEKTIETASFNPWLFLLVIIIYLIWQWYKNKKAPSTNTVTDTTAPSTTTQFGVTASGTTPFDL